MSLLPLLDRCLSRCALLVIRVYQVCYPKKWKRTCLYSPSCSHKAHAFFKEHGFLAGLKLTRQQIKECCGDYSMRFSGSGEIELILQTGKVVPEAELSVAVLNKVSFMKSFIEMGQTNPNLPTDSAN